MDKSKNATQIVASSPVSFVRMEMSNRKYRKGNNTNNNLSNIELHIIYFGIYGITKY